jgi:hypothetical protein
MANLTAERARFVRGINGLVLGKAVCNTGLTCFVGSLLAYNATGLLVLAADTAGLRIAGVARQSVASAAAGTTIEFEFGHQEFVLQVSGAWSGAALGMDGCMIDDSGVTTATIATNDVRVGRVVELQTINGAAGAWIEIARFGLAAVA